MLTSIGILKFHIGLPPELTELIASYAKPSSTCICPNTPFSCMFKNHKCCCDKTYRCINTWFHVCTCEYGDCKSIEYHKCTCVYLGKSCKAKIHECACTYGDCQATGLHPCVCREEYIKISDVYEKIPMYSPPHNKVRPIRQDMIFGSGISKFKFTGIVSNGYTYLQNNNNIRRCKCSVHRCVCNIKYKNRTIAVYTTECRSTDHKCLCKEFYEESVMDYPVRYPIKLCKAEVHL